MTPKKNQEGHMLAQLQKELDQELQKRDHIREKQALTYANRTHTRARTTSSNAAADRCNDRITWLRVEIKKLEDNS